MHQDYPERPRFWALTALRVMNHYVVAKELGVLASAVLTVVALAEDERNAPKFWLRTFEDRTGHSREAVTDAIQKCVAAGWLHWEQSSRQIAVAWIKFPAYVEPGVVQVLQV